LTLLSPHGTGLEEIRSIVTSPGIIHTHNRGRPRPIALPNMAAPIRQGNGSSSDQLPRRDPFPHTPDAFDSDPRVSYSKLDGKWILEDDVDGSEWEWAETYGKWVPSVRFA
jgi:hypothetical protein